MTHHVVVDGSNLATEGRSMPSLAQLNDAVEAFIEDNPDALITVVVDATFGHRIDPKEVADFEAGIEHNELVAPPAGAVGRGDAFVLAIANKVKATILSNDSFQEFHGIYDWLFDEGRLIGGKPVPHVGWVFVPRVPVRGPISRRSVRDAGGKTPRSSRGSSRPSVSASDPLPVPKAPPPGARPTTVTQRKRPAATPAHGDSGADAVVLADDGASDSSRPADSAAPSAAPQSSRSAARRRKSAATHAEAKAESPQPQTQTHGQPQTQPKPKSELTNDLMAFLGFVEKHPIGSSVNAVIDVYSSHGAYVKIGDIVGYLPLRLMASPPPRSAREMVKIGESMTLSVSAYHAQRRSIELCAPALAPNVPLPAPKPVSQRGRKKAQAAPDTTTDEASTTLSHDAVAAQAEPPSSKKPSRRRSPKAEIPIPSESAPVELIVVEAPKAVTDKPDKPDKPDKRTAQRSNRRQPPAAEAAVTIVAPDLVESPVPPAPMEERPRRGRAQKASAVADTPAPMEQRSRRGRAQKASAVADTPASIPEQTAHDSPRAASTAATPRKRAAKKPAPSAPPVANVQPAPSIESPPKPRRARKQAAS